MRVIERLPAATNRVLQISVAFRNMLTRNSPVPLTPSLNLPANSRRVAERMLLLPIADQRAVALARRLIEYVLLHLFVTTTFFNFLNYHTLSQS